MSVTLRYSRGTEEGASWPQQAPRSRIAVLREVCYLPAMKSLLPLLCLLSALLCSCPPALGQDKEPISDEVKALIVKAESGDTEAQLRLGLCYADGEGVLEDDKEAVKWYRKAADQGFAGAQLNLGLCYAYGEGVLEDDKEAVKWFRRAADQGHARAQANLGMHYASGWGVLEDWVEGYAWFSLAVFNGETKSASFKSTLSKKMTPEQITQGQQRSKELLRKIEEKQKKAK